jgi:hypothetical protein
MVESAPEEIEMLTPYDSGFTLASEREQVRQSAPLERVVQVVSVGGGIVAIVAGILNIFRGGPSYLVWVLVGVAALLIISAIYKPVEVRFRLWSERRKDRRVARDNWPKFRNFVHRFGDFVDNRNNNTLHSIIINDVPDPLRTELLKLVVNIDVWSGFYYFFVQRVSREQPVLSELAYGVEEFQNLVGGYNNHCVVPIFDRFPQQLRSALTDQSRGKLNTFRERYGHFLTEYMAFAKQFAESRPQLERLPRYLTYPTQL